MSKGAEWADLDESHEAWAAWQREEKARGWLADNLRRAESSVLAEAELVARLASITSHVDPAAELDLVCRAVVGRSQECQRSVASTLARLAAVHPGPGREAVVVDRTFRRILHRLDDVTGRPLALGCLRSTRRDRRASAWSFFRQHGLDDGSRELIAASFETEAHMEYRKLVAGDGDLVHRIGASRVIAVAPNRFWRSRVVEAALAHEPEVAASLRETYPAEWLWAVSRRHDRVRLPEVVELLRANPTDADLVNRVLLCVTELRDTSAVQEAIECARRVLEQPARPRPA